MNGRSCYNCDHYFESVFCGYAECRCKVHGSLDCGQSERHPDTTGATCPEYTPKVEHPNPPFKFPRYAVIMKRGRRKLGRGR